MCTVFVCTFVCIYACVFAWICMYNCTCMCIVHIYSVIAHDSISKFFFVFFVFFVFLLWSFFVTMLFPSSICARSDLVVIFLLFFYSLTLNLNIFHSTPNYHDVLYFNVTLLYRLDQSSFWRV